MKISKLITWQWGSLEAREWPFADTVLLTGESGSGKSTLLDSIQTLLTAAHHHLVQFNIGQDESTQSRRGGGTLLHARGRHQRVHHLQLLHRARRQADHA